MSDQPAGRARRGWIEPTATILIAVAAILTAWSAFQSAKWNGIQADSSREAAAAGTAASKQTTVASMQREIDVGVFLQWLQAVHDDTSAGLIDRGEGSYVADPTTLSGFLAVRFRSEFKPAFDAWIATHPLVNPGAPATPFQLPEYSLAVDASIDELSRQAEASFTAAGQATDRAENYVLLTVLFAIALVVTNIGSKLNRFALSACLVSLAALLIFTAGLMLATFPIRV